MSSNLYLVGFMGAGKSRVGRRLADILGWPFLDLDREIERHTGESIPDIFRNGGEGRFRALERQELTRVSRLHHTVVALGGGAFCFEANQEIIDATGLSVWLDAPLDTLLSRCRGGKGVRPLLAGPGEMKNLFESRRTHYARAQLHVQVGRRSVEELAREILSALGSSLIPGLRE